MGDPANFSNNAASTRGGEGELTHFEITEGLSFQNTKPLAMNLWVSMEDARAAIPSARKK